MSNDTHISKKENQPARQQNNINAGQPSPDTHKCDVKCQKCGERRKINWQPGIPCPVCGSKSFQPVIKVDHIEKSEKKQNKIRLAEKKFNFNFKKIEIKKFALYFFCILLVAVWAKIGWILLEDKLNRSAEPANIIWVYRCTACKYRFEAEPQIPPLECPSCHKKTVYATFQCLKCKARFPLMDRSRKPICPYCHCARIVSYKKSVSPKQK